MIAGVQGPYMPGRPGINALRVKSYLKVNKEEFDFIAALGAKTGINCAKEITAKEGYNAPPTSDGKTMLGTLEFILSDKSEYVMEILEEDIERVKKAIYEAKLQADYVIISIHSHQLSGDKKENPSKFLVDFAHTCIDAGANAIIGHGPHLLRPIEVYKDSPIFYSLGDFIIQLYNVEVAPPEFFAKQNLPCDSTVHELLRTRSKDFTRGLMTDPRMFLNIVPMWEMQDGKLVSLKLVPVMAAMEGNKSEIGLPRLTAAKQVVDYLGEMSKPYGITLTENEEGTITVNW